MPADAAQARLAAQIVVLGELADDTFGRSHAPELTVEQLCRLRKTAGELVSTADRLEHTLARRQTQPVAFFANVVADGVDVTALDVVWSKNPRDKCRGAGPMQSPPRDYDPIVERPAAACAVEDTTPAT
jgi:hypothetical protein